MILIMIMIMIMIMIIIIIIKHIAHPPCIIAENCFHQQCIFIVKSLVLF